MRILWLSNSPLAPSGYGKQSALFGPRIRDLGHDVAYAANHYLHSVNYEGLPIFDAHGSSGNTKVSMWAGMHQADWVICLYDSYVMAPDTWDDDLKMAIWAPIDHHPMPKLVYDVLQHEKVRPIAMSRFGESWMQRFDLDPLYVPHGVDTAVYKPHPDKALKVRQLTEGLSQGRVPEDAFIVGMVAANRGWSRHGCRKAFGEALEAFQRFSRLHDDAYLYLHTEKDGGERGYDMDVLIGALGIGDRVLMPPMEAWYLNQFSEPFMAGMYNAFDVLLNPSMSEGFGVPIIEAQACGVPVIVTNHSSMPELCGAGWLVEGQNWWDGFQNCWAMMPFTYSIFEALENSYKMRGDEKLKEQARRFAETYDADRVTELYWEPALNALYNDSVDTRQARRAREREVVEA